MKRRNFLKYSSAAAAWAGFQLQGFSVNPMPRLPFLKALAGGGNPNNRVLVLIQLTGGNDGLNTFIPLDQYGNLKLFYSIDPTDGVVQRSRTANLPPSIDPAAGFTDSRVRDSFIAYAAYVAKNYQPEYLALGVEVNMTFERAPEQFEAFVTLYAEAYEVVKGNSPKTKVFPTFQLEDLEGAFGIVHRPRWEIFDRFRGRMDVLAISTYPFLGEARSAADVRGDTVLDSTAQTLAANYAKSGAQPALPAGALVMRLSAGYPSFAEVFSSWRGVPADAAAIADRTATRAGLGVAYDPNSTLGVYWVLVLDD